MRHSAAGAKGRAGPRGDIISPHSGRRIGALAQANEAETMTEYINLVIKGDGKAATAALSQHTIDDGISIPLWHDTTQVKINITYLSKVFDWFLEPVEHPY